MGKSDTLDRAIADFGEAYAAQNQSDYQAFQGAIDDGRLQAVDPVTYDATSPRKHAATGVLTRTTRRFPAGSIPGRVHPGSIR